MEEKKIVMYFKKTDGKNMSITIEDPKDDVTEQQIKAAMDLVVSKDVFMKGNYGIESAVKAQIVTTNTTVYDLVL